MTEKKVMGVVQVLKQFFGKITMVELKELSKEDRHELATLAAEELGVTLKSA
jgi:hypothetical protein